MLGPNGFEKNMRVAMLVVVIAVTLIAPLIGCFAFSPLLVAWGIQPYPLAASLGCTIAEILTVLALFFLVLRARK